MSAMAYRVLPGGLVPCEPSPIPEAEDAPDVGDLEPLTPEQQMRVRAVVAIFDRAEAGQIDRREALRLARRAWGLPTRANAAKCGTRSGYNAHRRLGTPCCGPCRDAARAAQRAYRARRAGEGS